MTGLPLSNKEIESLCAAARVGLAALSDKADPEVMSEVWAVIAKIGQHLETRAAAIDKAAP